MLTPKKGIKFGAGIITIIIALYFVIFGIKSVKDTSDNRIYNVFVMLGNIISFLFIIVYFINYYGSFIKSRYMKWIFIIGILYHFVMGIYNNTQKKYLDGSLGLGDAVSGTVFYLF